MTKIKTNRNNTNNVPPLRFPEFSGEWREKYLGQIAEITKSHGISKEQLSAKGSPCILYGELYTKYKFEIINDIYSKTTLNSSRLVKSQANDVIIPCSGETAIDISTARCVPYNNILLGGDLNIIRLQSQDGGFFAYQLNGVRKREIACIAQGVSVVHLYGENLRKIKVYYPSIEEQRKITSLLLLIDKRIAAQNKIIEDLEQLKSALTNQLYSGQLRFHEFADDWGVSTFGHLTEHFSHRNRDSKHYPVFSVTKDTGFIPQEEQFESREIAGDDISSYKIIRQGEFAYNPARINVGSIARYDNEVPCLISSLYVCIKPAADIDSDWLLYLLKSKRAIFYYNLYGEGGVRIYLFYPNFSRIKVKVPSIQEQHKIAALLKYIADKILQERKLKDLYMAQKQFLLQRMFI